MNSTIEIINNRISLRNYKDIPISEEHENIIIESAMRAPTAGNMMLYSIIAVKDPEKKNALSKTCDDQPFIAKAPLLLIFTADYQKLFDYYSLSGTKEYCHGKNQEFIGPDEGNLMLAASDAFAAAQNAVIAAESLNIGSCYIGDIMENYEIHREFLKLPDFVFPVAMLCFGYYPDDTNRIPRPRFKRDYVVFNEEYRKLDESEIKEMYSGWDKKFSPNNLYNAKNMGQFHYSFKTKAEFAVEMKRSVKAAMKFWNGNKL